MKPTTLFNRCLQVARVVVFVALALPVSSTAQTPPIQVLVYGTHEGANTVYHYTVINNGTASFNNFTIGSIFDSEFNYDKPQLGRLPAGTTFGKRGEIGVETFLDPKSTAQPQGWVPRAYGQQDASFYYLEWQIAFGDRRTPYIGPGQTRSGFSVVVPPLDTVHSKEVTERLEDAAKKYVNGGFKVGYWSGGKPQEFRGQLEKQDTTPPSISVSVSPTTLWPPNGKLMPVSVTMSVKDDYDGAPKVKLESITANEALSDGDVADVALGTIDRQFKLASKRDSANKAGRIYTITYSATDATGNKATASTTVTVPHDQGK